MSESLSDAVREAAQEKFTLREAHERTKQIVDEVTSMLIVCSLDVQDDDPEAGTALEKVFDNTPGETMIDPTQNAKLFAQHFVERFLAGGPLGFTWTEEVPDDGS